MSGHTGVAWREWSDEAFAEAKAQDKPILLDIGAVWCHWCHVMDDGIPGDPVHTGTYSNPEVQRRIQENFIPIKVDNDRRPDINARYNMGGWPTTAFLTPDGDTLYGETYVPPSRMIGLLDYIADIYRNQRDDVAAQTAQMRAQRAASEQEANASDLDPETVPHVVAAILRNFDRLYGGFGSQPKFPHPAAMQLAVEEYARTGDDQLRDAVEKTLHGMADGGMYDQFAGGFFRYSTTRDWSIPHFEKMLEDNAKLTAVYAESSVILGDSYYLDVVKKSHDWLMRDMRDPETGAFAGSQDADKEEAYYGEPLDVRATLPTPYIDRTLYAGWNALMVSALVTRYKITDEQEILEAAIKTFDFLSTALRVSDPTAVGKDADESIAQYTILYHFSSHGNAQGSAGLLSDQTDFIRAAIDLYEVTGDMTYNHMAYNAAEYLLDFLEDTHSGGFYDLRPDPNAIGELARPKKDMTENAETALVLLRLSQMADSDEARFRQAAERALKLFAQDYANTAYFASSYARAVAALLAPPLHIVIVGDLDDARTHEFQHVAWHISRPGMAVETFTPQAGADLSFPLAQDGAPRAYVCIGTSCQVASTPQEIDALISGSTRG